MRLRVKSNIGEMTKSKQEAKFNANFEKVKETARKQKEAHLKRAHEAARRRQAHLDEQKKLLAQTRNELEQARLKHEAAQK